MASTTASLDEVLKTARLKKKGQALAVKILSSKRRASAPGGIGTRRTGPVTANVSLAKRVGISKRIPRSFSAAPKPKPDVDAAWVHDLHSTNESEIPRGPKSLRNNKPSLSSRNRNQYQATQANGAASRDLMDLEDTSSSAPRSGGFLVKGAAGFRDEPVYLSAVNFASRTTAQDIERVMRPVGGKDLRITSLRDERDSVSVEIKCSDGEAAQRIIDTFNNEIADGRTIRIYESSSPRKETFTRPSEGVGYGSSRSTQSNLRLERDQNFSKNSDRVANAVYEDGKYGFGGSGQRGSQRERSQDRGYSYNRNRRSAR